MYLYSLISIMHAQFGSYPTLNKKSQNKVIYKLFKTNVYVSAFN